MKRSISGKITSEKFIFCNQQEAFVNAAAKGRLGVDRLRKCYYQQHAGKAHSHYYRRLQKRQIVYAWYDEH